VSYAGGSPMPQFSFFPFYFLKFLFYFFPYFLHISALYAGDRRFETADASAFPLFLFLILIFPFFFFSFIVLCFYIPVIQCHTLRCRMPARTASQFLIYNPETIHIVELDLYDTRHQPISPNLKPTCILYIIWGRTKFYDDTNSLILNLALHLVNPVAARLVFCLAPFTVYQKPAIIALGLHRNSINGMHRINYFLLHLLS
jgi:hypothetical protein